MPEKSKPMTQDDASRIQSHADRTGENEDFKRRAQAAAACNEQSEREDKEEKPE